MSAAPGLSISGGASIDGQPVFRDAAFDAPAARWTCLLGPSGVGKSTLLRILAGIAEGVETHGRFAAGDGAPLTGRVALMAQDDGLLPWRDAIGNVTLGAALRGERPDLGRARALLDGVGLAELEDRRPQALSGGQRQRVALARTLMEDRPVVLLDEPFSALDARTRAEVHALAARLLSGRTVLHVTHDPGEAARLAHRIVLMGAAGCETLARPDAPPPRAIEAPGTLALEADLLQRLMAPV